MHVHMCYVSCAAPFGVTVARLKAPPRRGQCAAAVCQHRAARSQLRGWCRKPWRVCSDVGDVATEGSQGRQQGFLRGLLLRCRCSESDGLFLCHAERRWQRRWHQLDARSRCSARRCVPVCGGAVEEEASLLRVVDVCPLQCHRLGGLGRVEHRTKQCDWITRTQSKGSSTLPAERRIR